MNNHLFDELEQKEVDSTEWTVAGGKNKKKEKISSNEKDRKTLLQESLNTYDEFLKLLPSLNHFHQKLNILRYLTANSVFVSLSETTRLLNNTSAGNNTKVTNQLVLHQFEKTTAKIKQINGIQVYVHDLTHISFARNFSNKNESRNATHLLLEDFSDERFLDEKKRQWLHVQNELKNYLRVNEKNFNIKEIKYVAGMDVSFHHEDASIACAGIVIYKIDTTSSNHCESIKCVYTHCHYVRLNAPFITSFLVFREYNSYNELLSLVPRHIYPQLVCFDGNGLFHEIKFGMACHVGVLHDFASIGVSKTFSYLTQYCFRTHPHFNDDAHIEAFVKEKQMQMNDAIPIRASKLSGNNDDDETLAFMYVNSNEDRTPVFLSVGHRIGIDACLEFLKCLSRWKDSVEIGNGNFKRDSYVPFLVDHVDKMTRRAITDLEKNELLFKY